MKTTSRRCTIYLITNRVNGKTYVGQTWMTLSARWKSHNKPSSKGKCPHLFNALLKYGKENFTIEEIDSVKTQKRANILEIAWSRAYNHAYPVA